MSIPRAVHVNGFVQGGSLNNVSVGNDVISVSRERLYGSVEALPENDVVLPFKKFSKDGLLGRRIPLSDRTNRSDSSKSYFPESPVTRLPSRKLLTYSIFDDDDADTSSLVDCHIFTEQENDLALGDDSVFEDPVEPASVSSEFHKKPPVSSVPLRRVRSDYIATSSCRKRLSTEGRDFDVKRSRAGCDVANDSIRSVSTSSSVSVVLSPSALKSDSTVLARAVSTSIFEVKSSPSPPIIEEVEVHYRLPAVEKPQKDSLAFRSISPETLATEIRRLGAEEFEKQYILIDCRYPFEYNGGHVKTAINVFDQNEIESHFFPPDYDPSAPKRVPIFYCEFSQKRGPGMALKVRALDRQRNELNYPEVDYKEMYLLDRGYSKFWNERLFEDVCEPVGYVPMIAEEYKQELSKFKWHNKTGVVRRRGPRIARCHYSSHSMVRRSFRFDEPGEEETPSSPRSGRKFQSLVSLSSISAHATLNFDSD